MSSQTHIVQNGETLAEIAELYYQQSSYSRALGRANNIYNPDRLQVGQKLKIPRYIFVGSESKDSISLAGRKKLKTTDKKTGPGKYEYIDKHVRASLFNFDIDSAVLKSEHKEFLDRDVVPKIIDKNGITLIGFASRTGSEIHNEKLSELRMNNVYSYLTESSRISFECVIAEWNGERSAQYKHIPDDTEDEQYRAVEVIIIGKYRPKNPKDDIAKSVLKGTKAAKKIGFDDNADDTGKFIDKIGIGSSIIEEIAGNIKWVRIAATAEKVGNFAGNVGLGLNIVTAIVQMPLLWKSVDTQSNYNGRMQGVWEGIQDMADQYSSDLLDQKPVYTWPDIKKPNARPLTEGDHRDFKELASYEKSWMNGKNDGIRQAYESFVLANSQKVTINEVQYTGKELLRVLHLNYGKKVSEYFKSEIDKKIVKETEKHWPLQK